jgi:hypothetical protein
MPDDKRRLPVSHRRPGPKKYLSGMLMLPDNYKTVLLLVAVVIIVVVTVGLLFDPGPPPLSR